MELEPIGRFADPDELDVDPITVPIVGYTVEGRKEIITRIKFVPAVPLGAALALNRAARSNGNVPHPAVIAWLDDCVLDSEREAWNELLHSSAILVETETLVAVYQQLAEVYAARPTLRFSDSDGGPSSTNGTSQAAARRRASKSGARRSTSRSTSSTP
jgi:hypothetical protein